ncbi:MAG: Yip1 family protein [Veillonellales bacterium]
MGMFFETLYDVLFHPSRAMREIAADKKLGQSLAAFLLSVIIPLWAVYFGFKAAGMEKAIHVLILLQVIGSLLLWFVGAALWHLIAEILGGRGTAVGLLAALGFANIPRIFIVPLWVLAALMPQGIRPLLMTVTGLAIAIWILALDVEAIRGAHVVSGSKAVLILLTPLLLIVAVAAAMVAILGATMFSVMPPWL